MKLVCLIWASLALVSADYGLNQKTLVVSVDGFRQIYLDGRFLPWFQVFKTNGVYASTTRSVFPSDTFPNHWSIVTGMYPESHGILANSMYDPNLDDTFSMSDLDLKWWGAAEPIWVTGRRQGKITAATLWPGSAVVFPDNMTPNYYREKYDSSVPMETRIDETIEYLTEKNTDLAFIYYNQPDNEGHHSGPKSSEMSSTLQQLDWFLSYLLLAVDQAGLTDELNIILCSDHGMTEIKERLNLVDYIDLDNDVEHLPSYGSMTNLQPKPGKLDQVYQALKQGEMETGKFKVYLKTEMPEEYHYTDNDRIMDIVIVAKLGYFMGKYPTSGGNEATHGYDPVERHMNPMFMAKGPAFKSGGYKASKSFETLDIYSIIAYTAGIQPTQNNATFSLVSDIFA